MAYVNQAAQGRPLGVTTNIPVSSTISLGNFHGAPYSYTATNGYMPQFTYPSTSYGQTGFGHGLSVWNTWTKDYTDEASTITTPNVSQPITLNVAAGSIQVWCGQWNYSDFFSSWSRYDQFGGAGVALFNAAGTLQVDSQPSVVSPIIGREPYYGATSNSWQIVSTPALTRALSANTTYYLKYSGWWYRDDGNGTDSKAQNGGWYYDRPYYTVTVGP